jgi:cell filamentation protein
VTKRKHPDSQPDYSVIKTGGDPYVYPNTSVLRNLHGVRDAQKLQQLESRLTPLRLAELSSSTVKAPNTLTGFKAIHHHIFQDIYAWAGRVRKVDIYKAEEALGGASAPYSQPDVER